MRLFILSLCACALVLAAAQAQTTGGGSSMLQIPYGQTLKNLQFPYYQNGQLSTMISAVSAKGTTLNRAETTDLKIEVYDNGKVTTTITSPKADLYMTERVMRTKNTVQIERADMEATAQTCDFDLSSKKYLLRDNVKVILKNFDTDMKMPGGSAPATSSSNETPPPAHVSIHTPIPVPTRATAITPPTLSLTPANPPRNNASLLDSPGAYASTNVAPTSTPGPVTP